MQVEASITIAAPPERVFSVFTDFKNLESNVPAITKVELLEKNGEPVVGMKWRETRVMFGKEATETMWISEITSPQSYVVEAESHGVHYRSTYTFTPTDNGGTHVSMTFGGEPQTMMGKVMAAIFGSLMKGATTKALEDDMTALKKVAESG